jgi:hypothetical protein
MSYQTEAENVNGFSFAETFHVEHSLISLASRKRKSDPGEAEEDTFLQKT